MESHRVAGSLQKGAATGRVPVNGVPLFGELCPLQDTKIDPALVVARNLDHSPVSGGNLAGGQSLDPTDRKAFRIVNRKEMMSAS